MGNLVIGSGGRLRAICTIRFDFHPDASLSHRHLKLPDDYFWRAYHFAGTAVNCTFQYLTTLNQVLFLLEKQHNLQRARFLAHCNVEGLMDFLEWKAMTDQL